LLELDIIIYVYLVAYIAKYHVACIATVLLVFGILVCVYHIYYYKYRVAYIAPVLLVFDILVYVYHIYLVAHVAKVILASVRYTCICKSITLGKYAYPWYYILYNM
jgi:hypothetical protein